MKKTLLLFSLLAITETITAQAAPAPAAKTEIIPLPANGLILVYLPVALFLFFCIVLYSWARTEKLQLGDLLSETNLDDNHPATATGAATLQQQQNQLLTIPNQVIPPINNTVPTPITPEAAPQSTSRLILLLSGIAAIIISVSICSYSFFSWHYSKTIPDWHQLSIVLLSLGIGVVPYAVNKIFN